MTRPIRIEYAGAWYHVTCRGNERRAIFRDDADRRKLLEQLAESQELYDVEVHAYVLMSNHFHLLVKIRQANLQRFMQRFNTSYTVYYNRKYHRSGHLYQGRYKAILVDADEYLLELSRYIHLNPVKISKYRKTSLQDKGKLLQLYRWSSYPGYVQLQKREVNVSYTMVLSTLSGKDSAKARQDYKRFMVDGIARDSSNELWEEVRGQSILGSETFVDRVYDSYLKHRSRDVRELSGVEKIRSLDVNIDQIVALVAKHYKAPPEKLYLKRSPHAEARSVLIELSRVYLSRKMSVSAIGEELGGISVSAVSQNSKRLREKLSSNSRIRKMFESIEKSLQRG